MPRVVTENLVICSPTAWGRSRRVMRCPSERRRRRFVLIDNGWYGVDFLCCGCGNKWNEGFKYRKTKKQREKDAARYREMWKLEPFDNSKEWLK